MRGATLFVVLLGGAALAYGTLLQPPGCNQTAHYALVQSLAHGTPRIDRYHEETCDTAYRGGHYFAAKAPGLALATLPWFEVLRTAGLVPGNPKLGDRYPAAMIALPRRALWQVGLFGAVLPALALLLLVRAVVDRITPGAGIPTAGLIGLGTLVLPFATVFFAHVLAACLAFAAFALLFLRQRAILAGLAAGLAVCVDLPLAIVAAVLAVYAWRRAAPFLVGAAVGVLPLLVFNAWAFDNPLHLSYANAVLRGGLSGHAVLGANSKGFFGVGVPSLRAGAELLFSPRGLVILSPVLLTALAGLWRLRRSGYRSEALVAGAIFVVFLVYNAGYYLPFGGYVPGPRFLIATIPFLALGLGVALRDWPLPTLALGAYSITAMTVATAAEPLLGSDDTHSWVVRWRHGDFAESILSLHGAGHGWLALSPFLVGVVLAVAAIAVTMRLPAPTRQGLVAIAGVAVLVLAAPDLLHTDRAVGQSTGLVALIVLVSAVAAVAARDDVWLALAGAPLLLLALPGFAAHTKQSLLVAALSLAAAGSLDLRRRRERRAHELDRPVDVDPEA